MCGIIASIGTNTYQTLIDGLKQLQNRGYDSAGIASIQDNKILVSKYASKEISGLMKLESNTKHYKSIDIGIGHTRWATHGEKNDTNAHPHTSFDNKFVIVHNGIIENFLNLKTALQEKKIEFVSDTDTEVIVQLLAYTYQNEKHKDKLVRINNAIKKTLNNLQGTWGLVILCLDLPNTLFCTRKGSPILIGSNINHGMIVSEKSGFNESIQNYFSLNNNDICNITLVNNILKVNTEYNNYNYQQLIKTENMNNPGIFKHWTLKEIHEQPLSLDKTLCHGSRLKNDYEVKLGGLDSLKNELNDCTNLIILGCGTSFYSGQYSKSFFKKLCNFDYITCIDGAEFTENDIQPKSKNVAILISQSGETIDLYRCLPILKKHDVYTIGVVNVVDSMIARDVDCGIYTKAGREVGVASTKAFSCQVLCLILIAIWFSQNLSINKMLRGKIIKSIRNISSDFEKTIVTSSKQIEQFICEVKDKQSMFILGKGESESIAKEGALKIKEISYIHAEGYSTSSLKHGPFALLEEGFPCIILSPDDTYFDKNTNAYHEIVSRKANVLMITDKILNNYNCINIPKNDELTSLLTIIPLQLLAYNISTLKGINPDFPKNLAKVVTVE